MVYQPLEGQAEGLDPVARVFLAIVGAVYLALGLWCAAAPQQTSRAVGYTLKPGQGESEFVTVYGGLEVALGLLFLWPLIRPQEIAFPLLACLVVHGCLVVFRSAAFFAFSEFDRTTYTLAAIEWMILVATLVVWFRQR